MTPETNGVPTNGELGRRLDDVIVRLTRQDDTLAAISDKLDRDYVRHELFDATIASLRASVSSVHVRDDRRREWWGYAIVAGAAIASAFGAVLVGGALHP